jgi:hypothetical protein
MLFGLTQLFIMISMFGAAIVLVFGLAKQRCQKINNKRHPYNEKNEMPYATPFIDLDLRNK